METIICPTCGSSDTDEEVIDSKSVCDDCGLVFNQNEPPTEHEALGDPKSETADIALNQKERTWDSIARITNGTEKRLSEAFDRIESLAVRLGLPEDIRRQAAELYAAACREGLTIGRPADTMVAATVVLASRELQRPVPVGVVVEAAGVKRRGLLRLVRSLSIELDRDSVLCTSVHYLPYLAEALGCDQYVVDGATDILDATKEGIFGPGVSRVGVAAAAIYLASDGSMTQCEVARSAALTTETVRVRLRDFRESSGACDEH